MNNSLSGHLSHPNPIFWRWVKGTKIFRSQMKRLLLLLCVVLSLIGCATVQRVDETGMTPFQSFLTSTEALRDGTDTALAEIVTLSSERYMNEALDIKDGPELNDKLSLLRIKIPATPSENFSLKFASSSPPLFMSMKRFREGMKKSTTVLVNYSLLLNSLASPELLPKETFNLLARNLNSNAFDALSAIGDKPPDEEKVAIFSTVAIGFAEIYLESQRRSELIKALRNNQSTIEAFAAHMQTGIESVLQPLWHEYGIEFTERIKAIFIDDGIASGSERRTVIQSLIDLDREHIERLSKLHSLHQAFGQIPNAHGELIEVMENPELSLSAIITLLEAGKRLGSTYEQALASNKAEAAQAIADEATARADMLEAEAENAQLRASAAKVRAVKARAESEEDPTNEVKKLKADQLEKIAQELQEEADRRKDRASDAQLAAVEAQNAAIKIKNTLLGTGD